MGLEEVKHDHVQAQNCFVSKAIPIVELAYCNCKAPR